MDTCPNSTETEFYILSISTSGMGRHLLFVGVLLMYLLTVNGNLLITGLICLEAQLHTPMYFFLGNLSLADVIYVSTTLPKLLFITATQDHRIWFSSCITQLFFYMFSAVCDIFILTFMSYDRYVAICMALQYHLIMNRQVYISMAVSSWLIAAINSLIYALLTSMLSFCFSHEIDHLYCDLKTLYSITSSNTMSRQIFMLFGNIFFTFLPLCLTIISYTYVISTIMKIRSSKGRLKAFSSCSSHLTTVMLFYGPIIFLYGDPESGHSSDQDKLLSFIYMAVVPMLNPVVYTLRNREVLGAIKKVSNDIRKFLLVY
ncbi:olfactory receptor 1G1-like [Hyla sarda]|uniref:olfactory receptor 1G1-like n=1 Tax=Hyla sarda TaxID=327740 RepID=UPI0024C3F587|nr:olfactory receptor 1G1-like [Hyla sarda]XP_056427099.1 olfactory receptor 1G1-like [Hyla sarda]XP_056427100.1 olfactory receptor 1G1-like [Hyla sarda]XP_056427101.1 olfactory receptor 1G1-like [Hyla sarda]XP_056427102.1 olfactory receptor 1G1-like [Hyla sarda]XP_056427103.1 olfactory receptor 1G1-like [Hyla sarda]XP_056427104.1 olfactory receptor 1G1-like [Hyla sarda]XP_056427105.1 olfactory receptor 1G1-like [Hyla sarda]